MSRPLRTPRGPFRADQLHEGDVYELSEGHPILCLPTGGRGSVATASGTAVLASDPLVQTAGVDTGYAPAPDTLRAPDIAVGSIPDAPGWVKGSPYLAVEYADTGQDERDLERKVRDLLAAGTRLVWVVRLTGPRRVEVHEAGRDTLIARPGEELRAPGILANPVPVEALYDLEAGRAATFRNLLQRHGYASLTAVREEAATEREIEVLRRSVLRVLATRGLAVDDEVRGAIAACRDQAALERWLDQAVTAGAASDLFAPAAAEAAPRTP